MASMLIMFGDEAVINFVRSRLEEQTFPPQRKLVCSVCGTVVFTNDDQNIVGNCPSDRGKLYPVK